MDWQRLFSTKRYRGSEGVKQDSSSSADVRSPFTKDADRIVFSPYFRRLQDKTQVHLGPRVDIVRTRLTHSLETSSVGRSLGTAAAKKIIRKYSLSTFEGGEPLEAGDFGAVVAAACLAHDIGNTPFGHAGEEAIRHWFKEEADPQLLEPLTPEQQGDLRGFEANAQGFRVLTRLEGWREQGGLRLAAATLGSFLKYPMPSTRTEEKGKPPNEKFSYFQDDKAALTSIAEVLGLKKGEGPGSYCRHPLAYLVEAADDISYLIADLEDGVESQDLEAKEAQDLLLEIVPERERRSLELLTDARQRVAYLRAKAIGVLVEQVTEKFLEDEDEILSGRGPSGSILSRIRSAATVNKIKELSRDRLYKEPTKLAGEIAGYEVVHGLLDTYVRALSEKEKAICHNQSAAPKYEKIHKLLGSPDVSSGTSRYRWLLGLTDRISAMTDTEAMLEYQRLKGISVGPLHMH